MEEPTTSGEAHHNQHHSGRLKQKVEDMLGGSHHHHDGTTTTEAEGAQRHVHVGYKINGIRNVNSIDCTFTIDFKVFFYYRDDAFKGRPKKSTVSFEEIRKQKIFEPAIVISNEAELSVLHRCYQIKDPEEGMVKLSVYYRGTLLIPNMSVHNFPFDIQQLRICIKPQKLTIDQVELHAAHDDCAVEHHARHEWRIIGHFTSVYATNPESSTSRKVYSSLHVIVLVEREADWYVRTIMTPVLAVVVLTVCCYAIPVGDVTGRMESSVALVLANIATKFTVSEYLPKVPYRTLCDTYCDVSFMVQFGVCVSHAGLYLLSRLAVAPFKVARPLDVFLGQTLTVAQIVNAACFVCSLSVLVYLNHYAWRRVQQHFSEVESWREQALPASSSQSQSENVGVRLQVNQTPTVGGKLRTLLGRPHKKRVIPEHGVSCALAQSGQKQLVPKTSLGLDASNVASQLFSVPSTRGRWTRAPKFRDQGFKQDAFISSAEYRKRRMSIVNQKIDLDAIRDAQKNAKKNKRHSGGGVMTPSPAKTPTKKQSVTRPMEPASHGRNRDSLDDHLSQLSPGLHDACGGHAPYSPHRSHPSCGSEPPSFDDRFQHSSSVVAPPD